MKYKLRPKEVEAFRWEVDETPVWFQNCVQNEYFFVVRGKLIEYTLEGTQSAMPGDWIVKRGVMRYEFLSPNEFHSTYEAV